MQKTNFRPICLLLFFLLNSMTTGKAQDLVFSQFNNLPLHLNPALTGTAFAPRVSLAYRNQWMQIPNAYTSYYLAADHFLPEANSGIGLSIASDSQGDGLYSTTAISLHYAYNMLLNDQTSLAMGFEGGATQARVRLDKLVFLDQLNQAATGQVMMATTENLPQNADKWFADLGFGVMLFGKTLYGGLAARHLNVPYIGFFENRQSGGLGMRLNANFGAKIPFAQSNFRKNNDDYYISPNILIAAQSNMYQATVGATARLGVISAGGYFRYATQGADAVILYLGFQYDLFRLGYSYDNTISTLANSGGSHELTLTFSLADNYDWQRSHRQNRYNNCMRLFR
ncbi:MAG: hypothetical protein RI894_769 [Bacteroidota bacterium]|jgi:type IX secretion system PorP/SprF family membrane protein